MVTAEPDVRNDEYPTFPAIRGRWPGARADAGGRAGFGENSGDGLSIRRRPFVV
jgi:hypothetical protein